MGKLWASSALWDVTIGLVSTHRLLDSHCDMSTIDPKVERGAPRGNAFESDRELLGPYGCWPFVERRVHADRREVRPSFFSRRAMVGRRASGRRMGEHQNLYVDRYLPGDLLLAVAILVLNVLDAWFTLVYLDRGGTEANPVAQFLMDQQWFVFCKAVLVALCVIFLTVHKTFRFVRPALYGLFCFYLMLLGYHIYLHVNLPAPLPE